MRRALLASLLFAACGDSAGPEGALEQALARARPVSTSALGATAATTWEAPVPLPELSAHGLVIEAELVLEVGGARHRVVLERRIARQQRRFRVSERRTHEQPSASDPARSLTHGESFEAVFDGERLAARRGEGRWIERDAREGLPARILTRLHDLAPFVLTSLDDYLATAPRPPREGEATSIAGLSVAWYELALDRGVAPRPMPPDELRALRDHDQHVGAWLAASFQPTSARGHLASVTRPRPKDAAPTFDPAATLELELALSGPVKLESGAGTLAITLTQRVTGLDGVDFTLPTDRLPESRERPWKMIEDVLGDDLLEPYRAR